MRKRSIVLLSAGLDSAVNLFEAHLDTEVILALTFDYGQRAAVREVQKASSLCGLLSLKHHVVNLPWFIDFTTTSLINRNVSVPESGEVDINSLGQSKATAEKVWIPNRNGIFLNIAAGYAEGLGANYIVPGFNAEEASTFPDNSEDFIEVLNQSLRLSTASRVEVRCYTTRLTKPMIVRRGRELGVPFEDIWPCYHDGEEWCGKCESCLRFLRALKEC